MIAASTERACIDGLGKEGGISVGSTHQQHYACGDHGGDGERGASEHISRLLSFETI
tara:strand:- start:698 stop:868 length:171 start_codon:yes stop_codon:yes gene_type:complete